MKKNREFTMNFEKTDEAYLRIAKDIAAKIANGELESGARLDSENKLCDIYRENVYVIRKAIRHLKKEGLIYSIPKFGVYVGKADSTGLDAKRPLQDTHANMETILHFATNTVLPSQRKLWELLAKRITESFAFCKLETVDIDPESGANPDADIMEYGSFYPSYYSNTNKFMPVKEYFPVTANGIDKMHDAYGIPFSYSTSIVLYNLDLLKQIGFDAPSYSSYKEQMKYFEEVTAAVKQNPNLTMPATAQAAVLHLGNHLKEIMSSIMTGKMTEGDFIRNYRSIFIEATGYWKKYSMSYPNMARSNFMKFCSGKSPFFFGMNSTLVELMEYASSFKYGSAMMYSVDNTFCRVPSLLTVNKDTSHPVESMKMIREVHGETMQNAFAQIGIIPFDDSSFRNLPFQLKIGKEHAGEPLFMGSQDEYYICVKVINMEMWNVILFNKSVDDALKDSLMFANSYLNMKKSQNAVRKQKLPA